MINPKNFLLVREFVEYRKSVDQICEGSAQQEYIHLVYVLNWADELLFNKIGTKRPTLPDFLKNTRLDGLQGQLQPDYMKKILSDARRFFAWLSDNKEGFRTIKNVFIQSLKVKRLNSMPITREAVTIDEILAIASAPAKTIEERRVRAGAVMLFLSGMRIGAFVSLPIQAVDIEKRVVNQFPSLGVRTKNRKYGTTFLLNIPALVKVVKEWDEEVRRVLPSNGLWFALLNPKTSEIDPTKINSGENRKTIFTRNLKKWLEKSNLPYHSPHKFRHGFTHYGLEHAVTIEDYKAISMNLMHSSMEITDQYYSNLNDTTIQNRIDKLGNRHEHLGKEKNELFVELQEFLTWKRNRS